MAKGHGVTAEEGLAL